MKKTFLSACVMTFLVGFIFAPGTAMAIKTLKLGALVSNKAVAYEACEKLAEYIEKATDGEYTVKLFPSQQLGSGREMMQMLKLGTLDLYQGTNVQPAYFEEGKNFNTIGVPYSVRNKDEFIRFLSTPIFETMKEELADGGVRYIGYMGARTPRALTTTNTPVKTPADMKGLKIRASQQKIWVAFFKALGANPTPMPFSEFFMSAKTGVVDGQDNGIEVVYPRGLWEVQKYYMKTDHSYGAWILFAGTKKWNKWPLKLRKAIIEGNDIGARHHDAKIDSIVTEGFKKIQEEGMVVIDVDKEPFEAIARQVWADYDGIAWEKGFMDKVQRQLKAFRQ